MPTGQIDLQSLRGLIPDNLKPTLILKTPIGVAVIDPLAPAQDSSVTSILNALGIQAEVRFGDVPAEITQAPQLANVLPWVLLGSAGLLALFLLRNKGKRQ